MRQRSAHSSHYNGVFPFFSPKVEKLEESGTQKHRKMLSKNICLGMSAHLGSEEYSNSVTDKRKWILFSIQNLQNGI